MTAVDWINVVAIAIILLLAFIGAVGIASLVLDWLTRDGQ